MAGPRLRIGATGRRLTAAGVFPVVLGSMVLVTGPAWGRSAADATQVVMFLVDRVSFEELLDVPEVAALARAGGAALMASSAGTDLRNDQPYATLGGDGSMAAGLEASGVTVCVVGSAGSSGMPSRPELRLVAGPFFPVRSPTCGGDPAELSDPAFPGGIRTDEEAVLGFLAGGAGVEGPVLFVVDLGDTLRIDRFAPYSSPRATAAARRVALDRAGSLIRRAVGTLPPSPTLAIVATPSASQDMVDVGDQVTPLVMAAGMPDDLFPATGPSGSLRSNTTRLDGLVSDSDVAPTILSALGAPITEDVGGAAIRFGGSGAPFRLHDRHLQQRRIRLPVQIGEVVFISLAGLVAVMVLLAVGSGRTLSRGSAAAVRATALYAVALVVVVLVGGTLPTLSYASVVPFLVLGAGLLAWAAAAIGRRRGPLGPFELLGLVGLGVGVVDAALGSHALRVPLLGATMFSGVRFYGIPNAFLAMVLASALFVVFRLDAYLATVALVGVALVAGFPSLGADVGTSVTLLVAAGLWWVLLTRRRVGVREILFVAGVVALGLGTVLLANRFLGPPTHVTALLERSGGGVGGAIETALDRLEIGIGQVRRTPAGLIPLVGLPVVLGVALAQPDPIRRGFEVDRRWRPVVVTMTVAGIVAFLVNDTGVAAAAPVFLYAMAAVTYAVLVDPAAKPAGVVTDE